MFKYLLSMTILSSLVFCSVYSHANELGFYEINDQRIPEKVRVASKSVFQIRIAPFSNENTVVMDLTQPGAKTEVAKIFEALKEQGFDELDAQIVNQQIQYCIRRKIEKSCGLNLEIHRATAFLIEYNGDQALITNAHVVESIYNYIKGSPEFTEKSKELLKEDLFPDLKSIYIFDQNRKMVYNSRAKKNMAYIMLPEVSAMATLRHSFYAPDSDMVGILIPEKIGEPLRMAKQLSKTDEKIYLIGYPTCTNCKAEAPITKLETTTRGDSKNSDGKKQYISVGTLLEQKEALDFFDLSSPLLAKLYNLKRMLFHSADSMYGSSGGPILNSNGEAMGLHSGGTSKIVNGKHIRYGRGIIFKPLIAK